MMPEDIADIQTPEMQAIAKAHNLHPAVIALKWAVQRGQIPIPFSIYELEYVSNLRSTTEDPLTKEEMDSIATLKRNNRLVKGKSDRFCFRNGGIIMGAKSAQKPDSVIKQEGMKILLDGLGKVDAERFISMIMKEPFDYTEWQKTLFEGTSLEELSQKAMECYEEKKNK